MEEFKGALRTARVAIIGTTSDMAPADRKMYALRDVTNTVTSLPLITGSIMCKKLAENPDSLVLDVKTGAGAFMAKEQDAIELAQRWRSGSNSRATSTRVPAELTRLSSILTAAA